MEVELTPPEQRAGAFQRAAVLEAEHQALKGSAFQSLLPVLGLAVGIWISRWRLRRAYRELETPAPPGLPSKSSAEPASPVLEADAGLDEQRLEELARD